MAYHLFKLLRRIALFLFRCRKHDEPPATRDLAERDVRRPDPAGSGTATAKSERMAVCVHISHVCTHKVSHRRQSLNRTGKTDMDLL